MEPGATSESDGSGTGPSADRPAGSEPRTEFVSAYFHGTRADLATGDLISRGYSSNYGTRKSANFVYVTANLDVAVWGAELAAGEDPQRIYVVEPTGSLEDDPNVTDKHFPGNPTKSYRTREPVRVAGEVTNWQGHSPEAVAHMKEHLERLKEQGIEHINE